MTRSTAAYADLNDASHAAPNPIEEVVNAMEHFRKKMRGDMRGEELAACARLFKAIGALPRS